MTFWLITATVVVALIAITVLRSAIADDTRRKLEKTKYRSWE